MITEGKEVSGADGGNRAGDFKFVIGAQIKGRLIGRLEFDIGGLNGSCPVGETMNLKRLPCGQIGELSA